MSLQGRYGESARLNEDDFAKIKERVSEFCSELVKDYTPSLDDDWECEHSLLVSITELFIEEISSLANGGEI